MQSSTTRTTRTSTLVCRQELKHGCISQVLAVTQIGVRQSTALGALGTWGIWALVDLALRRVLARTSTA